MNKKDNYIRTHYFEIMACLVIIGAFIVVCMISFFSEFGVHPDEYDVRACLDWCENRFLWPDMRLEGEGLGDTYSGYGYTKVCNYTPYFLIFSKISFIFRQFMDVLPYYRMPNLLLMLFMTVYMLKNIKKHGYLMLGFGICVQAWYIFSYVTADAQDFVLSFVAVALLADRDSVLWKTLDSQITNVFKCVLLGLLYGVILLGKPYYYAILLLTFFVLIYKLIKSEVNNRKTLFVRYLIIAGVAFAVLLGRMALDLYYYGTDKASVKSEMEEKWADYDKKPSTPVEEQAPGWHLKDRGADLSDMFREEPHWAKITFRSFASSRITYGGDDLYFIIMAVLYAGIYLMMGAALIRSGDRLLFILGTALNVMGICASVVFSYVTEIQPQGRYLLPIILTTCYMGSRAAALWENRLFKAVIIAAACMSVMYFGLFDLRKLIDLSYVRTIIPGL